MRRNARHCCYLSGGKRKCMPAFETRTDSPAKLQKYPKIHVSTGEESSGSGPDSTQGLKPRHRRERNPERPPWNSHGDWPFLRPPERVPEGPVVSREHLPQLEKIQEVLPSRERIPGVPVASQEEALSTGKARGTPGSCQHSKRPQMCHSIPEERNFPALPRRSCRGSTSTTVARGTSLGESLEGKPRGKAIDALIHAAECVTLLLPLWRKAQVHARIPDED
ncbi:hypothetical protein MJT46_018548 [Ovis ammon polii x Ovis aries]|nr:hypothetical protein MJT46_018548 [Ovis ammon polii x Ovis aries]